MEVEESAAAEDRIVVATQEYLRGRGKNHVIP